MLVPYICFLSHRNCPSCCDARRFMTCCPPASKHIISDHCRLGGALIQLQSTLSSNTKAVRLTVDELVAEYKAKMQHIEQRSLSFAEQERQRWQQRATEAEERAVGAEKGLAVLKRETAERITSMQRQLAELLQRARSPPRQPEKRQVQIEEQTNAPASSGKLELPVLPVEYAKLQGQLR